jgi:indolepyruvate ferredoxin oxidoreductase alpha subunit
VLENEKQRQRVVSVLGDSTFVHSGITGLIEAVYNHRQATIVILDNGTTAMTGHQEHPGTGKTLKREEAPKLDLEALCRACGVQRLRVINPLEMQQAVDVLQEELEHEGISVIIARYPCVITDRTVWNRALVVDQEICDGCHICFTVGCPGLEREGNVTRINPLLCIGCEACLQACKQGAIRAVEEVPGTV